MRAFAALFVVLALAGTIDITPVSLGEAVQVEDVATGYTSFFCMQIPYTFSHFLSLLC